MAGRQPAAWLLALCLAFAGSAAAQAAPAAPIAPACTARGTAVPATRLALLGRGFNLTGWLDRKDGTAPDRAVLLGLRARGLTHVRLPVTAELYLPDYATPADVAGQNRALGRAVDELIGLGFAVSLDMHPGAEIGSLRASDPDRAFGLLDGLWRRLARAFADRSPERVFFEVFNEPTTADEYARAVKLARTIREVAPAHTVILGPPANQRIEALENVTPLADRNVVYAIHVYDPMAFTHQGLDWAGPEEPLASFRGVPFPSRPDHPAVVALKARLVAEGHGAAAAALAEQMAEPWGEAQIDRIFARAQTWSERTGAPVIANEFGVLAWQAPPADRARWIRAVRTAAEAHCVGWAHWDYADGFGFVRREAGRERPDPRILDALIDPVR